MPEGEVVRGHSPALSGGLTFLASRKGASVAAGRVKHAHAEKSGLQRQPMSTILCTDDFMHEPSAPPGKSYSIMMLFSIAIRRFPVDRLIKRSSTRLVSGARDANVEGQFCSNDK